ncbi:MAG: Ig-like domain-containing protein [Lachnospiraceae bacterium]|nr:Ig-like domain-containing protein [Lachnospiraceae bacterium]
MRRAVNKVIIAAAAFALLAQTVLTPVYTVYAAEQVEESYEMPERTYADPGEEKTDPDRDETGPDRDEEKDSRDGSQETVLETDSAEESKAEEITETEPDTDAEEPEPDEEPEIILPEEERQEAEEAFAALAAEKTVMAVVYLTDACAVYAQPDPSADVVATLDCASTVYLGGVSITEAGLFYYGGFFVGQDYMEGYILSDYLVYADEDWSAWRRTYAPLLDLVDAADPERLETPDGYADILQFPAGYQAALNKLKNAHPNWTFVPLRTGLDFESAVSNEMGNKSWIYINDDNTNRGFVGNQTGQKNWAYATRSGVTFYMDPRNFLSENYIFQFEQLTFNSSCHTVEAIQNFLNGTFMKGVLADQPSVSYATAFYNIGRSQGVSPTHLATRVFQEQGAGTSPLISGTYSGYDGKFKGYYNYFNVGASGSTDAEVIRSGLQYAKDHGWNTRYKSLQGGAATIGNNYIKKGQDTGYLQKFNVNPNAENDVYTHQYMQNIQAPSSESFNTRKVYSQAGALTADFIFKIPVYDNMPGLTLSRTSATINVGNTLELTASVNGTALDPAQVTWSSSDPSVARVSQGVVEALAPGTAVIKAKFDGNEVVCNITVKNPLREILLNRTEDTMRRSDTIVANGTGLSAEDKLANHSELQLAVSYVPANTTDAQRVTWTSSNKAVATVDANGLVKAVGSGTAMITAKAVANTSITAVCEVTVIAPVYRAELTSINGTDLLKGQSMNLSFEYWPKDTTSDTTIHWESTQPLVVGVSNGTVTALKDGKARVRAEIAGYSDTLAINVQSCRIIFHDTTAFEYTGLSYGKTIGDALAEKSLSWPDDPERDNAAFSGWYTQENGEGVQVLPSMLLSQKELDLFPHFEETGRGFYVLPPGDQIYTGAAIAPAVRVYDSVTYEGTQETAELVPGRDYTVSYSNNTRVDAGTNKVPTITVKGMGNYTGTQKVEFHILAKNITDKDIEVSPVTASYTGRTIKGNPVIMRNGKRLANGTDYTLSYPLTGSGAYLSPGVYPITVTGKGGYTGTCTVYEAITKQVLLSSVSVAKIAKQDYTGSEIKPDLKLTYKGKTLTWSESADSDKDCLVTYYNNTEVGTAGILVQAREGSGFTGNITVGFQITGKPLSKAKVYQLQQKVYTGMEVDVRQDFSTADSAAFVLYGDHRLTCSTDGKTGDYTVSYEKIDKAGIANVILTGINGYTGTLKKPFRIAAYDIHSTPGAGRITMSYHTVENPAEEIAIHDLSEIACSYCKGGAKPVVNLYDNGRKLELGKDYIIGYINTGVLTDTAPRSKPAITVSGRGNYTGRITGNYQITASDFTNAKITMTAVDKVYKASRNAWKVAPVLTDADGKALRSGTDYTDITYTYYSLKDSMVTQYRDVPAERHVNDAVQATDIPDAGTVIKITVTGTGKYRTDRMSCTYRIVKASLSKVKYMIKTKTYDNGHALTLTAGDFVYIRVGNTDLVYGEDCVIDPASYSYPAGWSKGKVTALLYAPEDSNYGGTKQISYSIGSKLIEWWK